MSHDKNLEGVNTKGADDNYLVKAPGKSPLVADNRHTALEDKYLVGAGSRYLGVGRAQLLLLQ